MAAVSMSQTSYSAEIRPRKQLEYFPVENVRLAPGPFQKAQNLDIEYLLSLNPDRLLAPYYKEAGLTPKAENYPNWEDTGLDGHIGGHYLSALSYMYAATGNEAIGQRLQYMLEELKKCQDAAGDGYLCGVPGGRAMWADVAAGKIRPGGFSLNEKWVPLYNIHKTFAGLKDAYVQTHSTQARDMLVALVDWMEGIVANLSDEQIQAMLASEHGGLNEVFADVAVITGEQRYLDLAHKFSHKTILEPLIAGRNELTGKHANTQIPKVIGYKCIADIEGRDDWNRGVDMFWNDVVVNRSVSIGGNSVREHFHSPDDFSSMLESEQGPETCNTYNMLRLTKMLYEADMQPRYTDYAERAIFNHILSSENHEHGGFVYFTPMRSGHYRVYSQPQTSFWCCVGSGMENHARYGEYIYAHKGNDDIYVELFIPSTLSWDGRTLTQDTEFPYSDTTTFRIGGHKPGKFTLNIRIPS
ncbi:MAG: glycoside hydrolase family 127 protein, partial [Muribaculaceae bacterium]|nr:glycoside hydrolase family 127 protein [Muribaculaceae bacterium]